MCRQLCVPFVSTLQRLRTKHISKYELLGPARETMPVGTVDAMLSMSKLGIGPAGRTLNVPVHVEQSMQLLLFSIAQLMYA
jgi:hypothetical protein